MYVELSENKCEGMISLKSMSDDQYFFDPGTMTVTGYHSQNSFKMGQEVKVRVKKLISLSDKLILFSKINF